MASSFERLRQARATLAKDDANLFTSFVMKDEETGNSIRQAPIHRQWHALLDSSKRVVLWSHVEAGKTQQLALSRVLQEIGKNPDLRVVVVGATGGMAAKITRAQQQYIERSEELRMVFPNMEPGLPWSGSFFSIKGKGMAKDPNVQATGVHGNILGARIDLLILDDILTFENTRTEYMRKDTLGWIESTLIGRLTKDARVWFMGNTWHPEDAMHIMAKRPGWISGRFPVLDTAGNSNWPSQWPIERIREREAELGPLEFARTMMCQARSETDARFKRDWIEFCKRRGEGRRMPMALTAVPRGYATFTGVDLGVSAKLGANLTVFFTICVHPDGSREVLCVESGKWTAPDIVQKIIDTHHRYNSLVLVENNAAQDFLVQFTRSTSTVPVRPFTTGRNKHHPQYGVESIGAELAKGQWIIPNRDGVCSPEVQAWIEDMLYYDPSGHTPDRIMASWFAREGARSSGFKVEYGRLNLIDR